MKIRKIEICSGPVSRYRFRDCDCGRIQCELCNVVLYNRTYSISTLPKSPENLIVAHIPVHDLIYPTIPKGVLSRWFGQPFKNDKRTLYDKFIEIIGEECYQEDFRKYVSEYNTLSHLAHDAHLVSGGTIVLGLPTCSVVSLYRDFCVIQGGKVVLNSNQYRRNLIPKRHVYIDTHSPLGVEQLPNQPSRMKVYSKGVCIDTIV